MKEAEVKKERKDIWLEGVKSIMGYHKRSLLDYIDVTLKEVTYPKEKERMGKIKGRVHNELSQAAFGVGVLLETLKAGGNITPFEDNIYGKNGITKHDNKRKVETKLFNKEIKEPAK